MLEFNKNRNEYYDFMGSLIPALPGETNKEGEVVTWHSMEFPAVFDHWYKFRNNAAEFKEMILRQTRNYHNWSIKHGILMFIADDLKRWFPESRT